METRKKLLIRSGYTDKTIEELALLIQLGKIKIDKLTEAELEYNCLDLTPTVNERKIYPLRFFGKKMEVWVADVAGGYKGLGPLGAIEALEMFGFTITDIQRNTILGDSDNVILNFHKN